MTVSREARKKRLRYVATRAILAPKYAILDETDSGLDVDALAAVGKSLKALRASEDGKGPGFLSHHALSPASSNISKRMSSIL